MIMMLPQFLSDDSPHHRRRLLLVVALVQACCMLPVAATSPTLAFVARQKNRRHDNAAAESIRQDSNSKRSAIIRTNRQQRAWRLQESTQTDSTTTVSPSSPMADQQQDLPGLYRPFAEYAWNKLQSLQNSPALEDPVPEDLRYNSSPAKGFPPGSTVAMEIRAMKSSSLFRYARFALLETKVAASPPTNATTSNPQNDGEASSSPSAVSLPIGIQVLNFVILPHQAHLPVWGVDLVSLPGDRHLMLLDAQPVQPESRRHESHWTTWHETHAAAQSHIFPWGGDIPGEAAQYVSGKALWTRLQGNEPVRAVVQGELWQAFCEHLDLYVQLLQQQQSEPQQQLHESRDETDSFGNPFESYLQYRLANDPARPMLRALYGPEWTERVLHEVLFPQL